MRYASALLLYDSSWPGPLTFLQHNRVAQHDAVSKATARLNQLRTATVKSAAAEEGNALIESHESLPLEVHPVYVNYLRMQAAGIDPAVIRERMVRGVWCVAARQELFPHECGHWPRTMQAADSPNPKVVHWSPTTLVELQDAAGVESHVPASRHPLYVRRVLSGYRLAVGACSPVVWCLPLLQLGRTQVQGVLRYDIVWCTAIRRGVQDASTPMRPRVLECGSSHPRCCGSSPDVAILR